MTTILLFATPSLAVDRVWTNALSTQEFTSAGNWNPTTDPLGATDNYYINLYGAANSPILGSTSPVATVGQLSVGSNYGGSTSSGRLIINGGTLTANDQVVIGWNANTTDTSYLDMTGGTFNFIRGATETDVRIGFQGGKGQMNLSSGAIANINNGGRLFLGDQAGSGQLNMTDSTATITTGELVMACGANSLATANINGSSTLNISGGAIIGDGGTATMTMSNTASVTNYYAESYDKNIIIGRSGGYGTLNVTGGYYEQFYGYCILGDGTGATGEINVSGSGYFNFHKYILDPVNNVSTYMMVGNNGGKGKITVSAGTMEFQGMMLGRFGNSEGTLDIQGGAVTSGGLCVGFDGGKGIVTMSGGSFVSTAGTLEIGRNTRTNSKFTLSGGTVSHSIGASDVVIGVYGGEGTLELTGGTFDQSAGSLYLGNINYGSIYPDGRAKGYLNIANSAYNYSTTNGTVYVGNFDCDGTISITAGGAMTLSNEAELKVGSSTNSAYGGSIGTINMNGGTFTNGLSSSVGGATYIGTGWGNTGRLDMSNGATFTQGSGSSYYIGDDAGTGTLTMVGSAAGVEPAIVTTFNAPNNAVRVGNSGTGTIIMGQNSVLNAAHYLVIGGGSSTGNGTLNMTGNALINKTTTRSMLIAEFGRGTVTMEDTARIVCAGDVEIGKRMNATGELTMNDNSSISLAGRSLYLGYGGTGTLNIYDSATVSAKLVRLGTSATDTTVYTGSGILKMGNGLAGENPTITTETNGTVSLGVDAGSSGTLTINSGSFNIGNTNTTNIGLAGGTGTIVINDGGMFKTGTIATGKMSIGSGAGSTGTVTVNAGGTFDTSATALTVSAIYCGNDSGTFTWNQNGGNTVLPRVNTGSNGAICTYNFNGGVFAVSQLRPVSTATVAGTSTNFNFDGGTIRAREITGQFIWSRGDTTIPGNVFNINVKSGGMIVDPNGIMGLGGNYGIIITTPLTSVGTTGKLIVRDSTAGNLGNLTLYGNSSAFVGDIDVEEGSLVGRGVNALGLGSVDRTIKVNATGKLGFRSSNTSTMYAGDFASTVVPTINVDGGTLFVDPYITFTGTGPWVQTFFPTRATVNNVTLKNATMTSSSEDVIGTGTTTYAWNINGTITSEGNSTINYTVSQNLACPNTGLIALQSGDMANPNTTFDVQDGTLTVSSPLTDGLSTAGVARATSLTKAGQGTMSITGALNYTGNTDIQDGTFQIATTTPVTLTTVTGTSAGTLAVCDGATLTATSIQVGTLSIGGPAGAAVAAAVPEPGTFVLLALAGLAMAGAFCRRK